jgi:hypothetical protein
MIGPLPTAPGGFNKVLVAIDKFTKWIKVNLVTCPKADRLLDFLDELVHRYSMLSRSDYTMLLIQKEESGSRNCPMHSGGCVLNPPSRRDSLPTSWSMAPKLFYLPTSCGTHWQ